MRHLLPLALWVAGCSPAGSSFTLDDFDTGFRGLPDPAQAPGPRCTDQACEVHTLTSSALLNGTQAAAVGDGSAWHTGSWRGELSLDGTAVLDNPGGAASIFLVHQAADGTVGTPIDLQASNALLLTPVDGDAVIKLSNPSHPDITTPLPDAAHVLARVQADGTVVWVHDVPWNNGATLGGDGDVMALFMRDDGRLFAAGWMGTSGTMLGHDFVIDGLGQTWVGEIDVDTGILTTAHLVGSVEVYGVHVDDEGTYTVTGAWGTGSGGAWGERTVPEGGNLRTAFVGQVAADGIVLGAYDLLAAGGADQCTARDLHAAGGEIRVLGDCNLSVGGGMPPEIRPFPYNPNAGIRETWVARFDGTELLSASQVGTFSFFTGAGLASGPGDYLYTSLGDTRIDSVTPDGQPYGVSRPVAYVRSISGDGDRAFVQLESNSTGNSLNWGSIRQDALAPTVWLVTLDLPR